MSALTRPVTDSLPLTRALWVDNVCLRFEDAWKAEPDAGRPALEEYLAGARERERSVLLGELIRLDAHYRRLKGEAPRAEEYERLFPDGPPDWLAEAAAPPPEEGAFFGRYDLLEKIGRAGGMGVVYKVQQRYQPRKVVALKTIRAGRYASDAVVERFFREVRSVAELDHPHIVPIYEVGEHEGKHYFTMRWLEGGSLAAHVGAFRADPRAAARLLVTVARALHYAHQRRIVHRDLKPQNILLEGRPGAPVVEWSPVVADFGLAAWVTAEEPAAAPRAPGETLPGAAALTRSDFPLGTAAYMAPEQAAGERLPSTAIDVYGLGAVLYELLTGRPPFQGEAVTAILKQVKTQAPAPPRQLAPRVNRELEAVCLKCLEKDPARRYPSAEAVAEDLERWLQGKVVDAYPVVWPRRLGKWAWRRPAPAALLLTLALLAAFGTGTVAYEMTMTQRLLQKSKEQLYVNSILLAERAAGAGRWDQAERALALCPEELRGWEWNYLKRVCRQVVLVGHTGQVVSVEYSPDGSRVVTAGWDGTARVWSPATGELLLTLKMEGEFVSSACFSSDGRVLITAGKDQVLRFWDAKTGALRRGVPGGGTLAAAARRGRFVASLRPDNGICIWDADRGEQLAATPKQDQEVTGFAFSPDGEYLAVAGFQGLVKVWKVEGGKELVPLPAADLPLVRGNLWAVAFSPDGQFLAVGGAETQVFDLCDHRRCRPLFGTGGLFASQLAFSPDGKLMAGTYRDGLRVWDMETGKIVRSWREHADQKLGVAFSPDGKHMALTRGREVHVEELKPAAPPCRELVGPAPSGAAAVAFSPDGRRLASRAGGREVTLWDVATGRPEQQIRAPGEIAKGANLAFSRDGRWLVSGCRGDRPLVWDVGAGRPAAWGPAVADTRCCAVSPDGALLATADERNDIVLWEAGTGREVRRLERAKGEVTSLAFRPRHRRLASCGADGAVRLWDTDTGKEVRLYGGRDGHLRAVNCVTFSPDGRRMATASDDLTVRVWDVDRAQRVFTLEGHDGPVYCVAFSPDGRRLASASHDGTVKLWDAGSGKELLTLTGHDGVATGLAFSPDGRLLASCSSDGRVRLWDGTPPPKEAAR
jgi:WD40 repeat protein/tRNA A-37 threonylcarbamoyl transferase component Bud32